MDSDPHQSPPSDRAAVLERLGTALRDARNGQGLERAALAARLNMGDEQLMALENADLDRLPEPVFVIAQARRVADALGLDISLLVAPLKQPSPVIAAVSPSVSPITPLRGPRRRPTRRTPSGGRRRALGILALLCGIGAAGVWAWPQRQALIKVLTPVSATQPGKPAAPPAKPKPVVRPTAAAGVLTLRSPQPSWLEVRNQADAVLFKGTFKGERAFPLGQGLTVLAGRPDLVQVSLGGSPARPLGSIDQIRWVSFRPATAPVKAPTP